MTTDGAGVGVSVNAVIVLSGQTQQGETYSQASAVWHSASQAFRLVKRQTKLAISVVGVGEREGGDIVGVGISVTVGSVVGVGVGSWVRIGVGSKGLVGVGVIQTLHKHR